MHALRYSVRPLPVLKYFGQLCVVLALLTLVPLVVSAMLGSYQVTLRYSVVVVGVFVTGFFLRRLPTPKRIQTNEAMVVTALIFLFGATVMTRYRGPERSAEVTLLPGGRAHVRFLEPQRAPAPGQAAVFYHDEVVLGGGTIAEVTFDSDPPMAERSGPPEAGST